MEDCIIPALHSVQRSGETTYLVLMHVLSMGSHYAAAVSINTSDVLWHSKRNKEKQ